MKKKREREGNENDYKYLDLLPYRLKYKGNYYGLGIYKNKDTWTVHYFRIMKPDAPLFENTHQKLTLAALGTLSEIRSEDANNIEIK